jgi:hypothetical protein
MGNGRDLSGSGKKPIIDFVNTLMNLLVSLSAENIEPQSVLQELGSLVLE